MKTKTTQLIFVFLFLFAATAWGSPVGQQIYFTKTTQLPAPAAYHFRFSLWDTATGGNESWWEEKTISMNTEDLMTNLGSVTNNAMRSGPLKALDFSEQYWVQVERLLPNNVTWQTVGARTRFHVVPYAMWSAQGGDVTSVSAGNGLVGTSATGDITLDVGAGSGITVGPDSISIAAGGVTSAMLANGAVGNAKIANGAVTDAKITGPISIVNGGTGSSTKNFVDLTTSQTIGGTKTFTNTIAGNISGNAATATTASSVTNGVYTTGSYADPAWITSLSGAKITGDISGNAANVTGIVAIANGGTGAATAPAALTNLGAAASGANSDITSLSGLNTQAAIRLNPFGAAPGNTGEVRFRELTTNGTNYVGLKAPDLITANNIWTLPASDGTAGQMLTTDGAGMLGWAAASGGTVTNVSTGTGLTGGPITTSGTISLANTSVTAGSYARANITVDAQGRLTSAANGSAVNLTTGVTGVLPIVNGGTGSSTQNFVDLSTTQTVGGAKTFSSTITGDITGNAGTVTNGVYTTGSYADPAWITSLAGSKITGDISVDNLSLPITSATVGQIKLGGNRFIHAYGSNNTFVGEVAGNFTMTGDFNTASGKFGLFSNTSGSSNTASGDSSLSSNTSGDQNTASGVYSLYSNITGSQNTALGYNAGSSQTTGSNNIYIGYDVQGVAGESNVTRIGNGQTQAIIAGTVTAIGFVGSGSGLTGVTASTVTDGVYTTGSYADPAWITSLAGSKISGNISGNAANVTGVVAIANGGTGANNTATALSNLGAAASGANSDITSLSGLTTPLSIAQGGTGSSTQNFVDLTTTQTVGGAKTFSEDVAASKNILLPATTATTGQIKLGGSLFAHIYGTNNTFIGINAGNLTMTGVFNTAIGNGSLFFNTTGNYNTASGYQSLILNTTGNYNTASGMSSLEGNTLGSYNTASGSRSLILNTTSSQNTAIGAEALRTQSFNGGGFAWNSDNTAVGFQALFSNQPTTTSTGVQNTAVGSQSLYANTTGYDNTASGYQSLFINTTGYDNTASGYQSLYSNTDGYTNTASGYRSLFNNTTGRHNAAYGGVSLSANTTGYENTATGVSSLGANTTGFDNTASGFQSLFSNTSGSQNTALGIYSGYTNTTGSNNTFVGYFADAAATNLTNATAIGNGAIVDASNHVRIGNTSVTQIGGQVAWSNLSDIRTKKDIQDIGFGLDFIKSLKPVKYRMKQGNDRIDFGFISQDIEALLGADYNILGIGEDADRTLSLRYTDFIAPLVKAIQEQQTTIEAQQDKITDLEARLARLEILMSGR